MRFEVQFCRIGPDGTVQTQSGCTILAGALPGGDCGNGFRFPPGQARTQQAGLMDFCGAAAAQHRRGAPVSRAWEGTPNK